MRQRKPLKYTIRDIAKMAEVSRSTVSLALNNSPLINEKTKQRVLKLIEEVGYRPNQSARNLVRKKSATICAIIPKLEHVIADTYFAESLSGILDAVTQRGYHLLLEAAEDTFKAEDQALKLFRQGAMDGVLCVGALTTDTYLEKLLEAGCPVVLVNSCLAGVPDVIAGNVQAAVRAVKHLHSLGHTRIAHIRGSEFVTTAIHRTQGYLQGMQELGLPCESDLIAHGYFDQKSGYQATQWLLSRRERPTAIFTTNDMMALGAMEAIHEEGLRVPQDVALFGGDDIQLASYVHPALSTMRQNMHTIGQAACESLCLQLEGKSCRDSVMIALKLVIRESCGARSGQVTPLPIEPDEEDSALRFSFKG